MSTYEVLKFLHVVAAIVWVGSVVGFLVFMRQLAAADDHDGLLSIMHRSKSLGNVLFMPAVLVTLGAGIAMVAMTSAIGFGDLWILIGFGGIVVSGVVQMAFAEPAGQRFVTLAEEHGTGHTEVAAAARRLNLFGGLDAAILLFVVWAMVAKPML